jgi:undecaprenyl-diphosphatase
VGDRDLPHRVRDSARDRRPRRREQTQAQGPHRAAQALALIPGVSRSGGTITAGLFLGYERRAAARYSFLLAIPAVLGSGFYELYKSIKQPTTEVFGPAETALSTGIAFVVGLLVIVFFMNYISKRSFLPFVVYRILLGAVLIVLLVTGALQPV